MDNQNNDQIEVVIENHRYDPPELNLVPGTTVSFINNDEDEHTVTADDASFDEELAPGEIKSITFNGPGPVDYYCRYHPEMRGTINNI